MDNETLAEKVRTHNVWLCGGGGERADLRGANLRHADLWYANLWGANLRGANLRGADLRDADLRGADLRGANLWGANLRGADLRDADLRGADLWDADLWDADLRYANLWGADLRGAYDAPLLVQVGPWPVYIHSGYMRIGCERHQVDEWRGFSDDRIALMDGHALEFWHLHRGWLLAACDAQMQIIDESNDDERRA